MDMIDNVEFIEEVKQRPGIWNFQSEEYQNKLGRNSYWEEICEKFIENYAQKSAGQRFEAVLQLKRKWKSLRDSYMRYRYKMKEKRATGENGPKTYLYAPYLSFLLSINGEESEAENSEPDRETISEIKVEIEETRKRKTQVKPVKQKVRKVRRLRKIPSSQDTEPVRDEDKLFLLSLLRDFRKISEDLKLDAKVEIMEIIKKYKQSSAAQNFVYIETCNQDSDYE